MMTDRCTNRYTTEKDTLFFNDRVHKFYMERRCENTVIEGKKICSSCILQYITKRQASRRYPHGRIHEPIPPHSHLFGGEWYTKRAAVYGEPSSEYILYAIRCQEEARYQEEEAEEKSIVSSKTSTLSKEEIPSLSTVKKKISFPKNMPRPKKNMIAVEPPVPNPVQELTISTEIPDVQTKIKRVRKPRVADKLSPMAPVASDASDASVTSDASVALDAQSATYPPSDSLPVLTMFQEAKEAKEAKEEPKEKPKKVTRRKGVKKEEEEEEKEKPKRKAPTKKKGPVLVHPPPIVHKDSCIPTHLEEAIEEHPLDEYETEYVPLSIFILDEIVYFREVAKNKLYQRIKEKTIGKYVGRYDPTTDSLVTDIPDSDDEE